MPSPFPGMDPYLEAPEGWMGFHNHLAAEISAALNGLIQPRYYAELTSFVTYEVIHVSGERHGISPDVFVAQPLPVRGETRGGTAVLEADPATVESTVPLEIDIYLDRVEVRTVGAGQLVTLIEILSPVNKRPSHGAHAQYLRKRRHLFRANEVHLLEIDLLRAGTRPPLEEPVPETPYRMVLSRSNQRPKVQVWAIPLWERLPVLPVPLLAPDPDTVLDLGAVVASVYERGAYGTRIDYAQPPPPPPLTEAEGEYLEKRLREQGLRAP